MLYMSGMFGGEPGWRLSSKDGGNGPEIRQGGQRKIWLKSAIQSSNSDNEWCRPQHVTWRSRALQSGAKCGLDLVPPCHTALVATMLVRL